MLRGSFPALRPGIEVGSYQLTEFIGYGCGLGADIWRASRKDDSFILYFCFVPVSGGPVGRDVYVQAFLRDQASACKLLRHQGLHRPIEVRADHDPPFVVLPDLKSGDGEMLDARMQRAPLSVRQALGIGTDLLDVLGYLHARGMLFLSGPPPSQVWLRRDGHAVAVPRPTLIAYPRGRRKAFPEAAFARCAPETLARDMADELTDLYSLGILLYELLAGALPFAEEKDHRPRLTSLLKEPIPPLRVRGAVADVAPGVQRLIDKSVARERECRFQSAAEMRSAVVQLASALEQG